MILFEYFYFFELLFFKLKKNFPDFLFTGLPNVFGKFAPDFLKYTFLGPFLIFS